MNVFHDTLLEVDGWPRTAADGEVRCLPWNERAWIDDWTGFYVDSACTTQAAIVIVYHEYLNPDCSAPQYASSSVTSTPACGVSGGRTQVNLVGAPTSVYLRSGGNCTSAAEAATNYYRVGDVVAPSTFVLFTKG